MPRLAPLIIPLREKIGNYDIKRYRKEAIKNYTTTRENWELRPVSVAIQGLQDYTTTRENWELRLQFCDSFRGADYTTTRENWELRLYTTTI